MELSEGFDESEGSLLGNEDGTSEGVSLGESESDGSLDGSFEGVSLGSADTDGAFEREGYSEPEGSKVTDGSADGFELGSDDGEPGALSPEGELLGSVDGSMPTLGSSLIERA